MLFSFRTFISRAKIQIDLTLITISLWEIFNTVYVGSTFAETTIYLRGKVYFNETQRLHNVLSTVHQSAQMVFVSDKSLH